MTRPRPVRARRRPRCSSSARTRHRSRRLRLGASILATLALAASGHAESPLPFTPEFAQEVESTFFDGGEVSPAKLAVYRARLQQRRDEIVSVFARDAEARGRSPRKALSRAVRKKEVEVYDRLLVADAGPGWLDRLATERDPVAARRLAGRILEVDDALRLEGAVPRSISIPENLASISVLEWSVPGSTVAARVDREATNLVDPATGLFLEPADLRRRVEAGDDLSTLDPPADSSFWRDPGAIAGRDVAAVYYGGEQPALEGLDLRFPESRGRFDGVKKSQTKPKFEVEIGMGRSELEYKLKVGGEIHSEPVTGALLAVLGFNADVVRYVRDFRIDLGDVDVETVRDEWRSYFEFKRIHLSYRFDDYFEVGEDADGAYLIAKEATLTAKPEEVVRVGPWPWGANGNEGLRETRALGLLSIWLGNTDMKEAENNKLLMRPGNDGAMRLYHLHHDLGHAFGRVISEQVDAFPWDLARRGLGGRIVFNYHSTWNPSLRERITWADARWMTRRIAQLTRRQIEDAVALGAWPEPVGRLLVEKLIQRRNQLVEVFDLVGETTPSGPIALLAVDREITTPDGRVVDGELVDGVFEGSTQDFDDYWTEFVGPVWEAAKLEGVGVFQRTIGLVPALIFDSDSVGLPKFVVLDLLITLKREVEENPRPTDEGDYYLVRDQLLLGLRVGGGLIATGTTAVYRSWTLVQPAGTRREATYAGDTILDVRLPWRIWKERLPERFSLVRETYLDLRAHLTTEDLGGSVPPLGATASAGLVRLSRDVLARRRDGLRAYQDTSVYSDQAFEAFLNLVFVRIPFVHQDGKEGALSGRYFDLSDAALHADDPVWSDALSRLVRDGDFSGVEARVAGRPVHSRFSQQQGWARIPFLIHRTRSSRFDRVTLGAAAAGAAATDAPATESFVQYHRAWGGFWSLLDWGEDHLHTTSALARVVDPAAEAPGPGSEAQRAPEDLETPRIVSTWFLRDRNTFDDELARALGFINGLAPGRATLIDFTPALHSANGRWGDLEIATRVGYSRKAVKRLARLDVPEFWSRFGERLGVESLRLARYREHVAVRGKWAWGHRARVPWSLRAPVVAADRTVSALARAGRDGDDADRMRDVVDGLAQATFRRGGTYDPVVLGALHDVVGREQVSIEAVVRPPPWVENRLPGSVPLVGATPGKRHRLSRMPIDFDPLCTAGLYGMLDTFPGDEVAEEHYGNVCDGARGTFTR